MDTVSIGRLFKQARKAKSMTQQDIADKLMVSPQAVSKWERGESMPDISLLQEVADTLDIGVTQILNAGSASDAPDTRDLVSTLTKNIDESLYKKILGALENATCAADLDIPAEAFMFLTASQKSRLIDLIFHLDDYEVLLDDLLQYTNIALREKILRMILARGDYDSLEPLIPFTTRKIKTEIVATYLENSAYDHLEGVLPFLNREQKDMIINYVLNAESNTEVLENFMPFFDQKQRSAAQSGLNKE